jgi:transposase
VEHYAGLDVSLELTSVCVVDARGEIVREAKVASEPEVLIRFLQTQELEIGRVGLEAGPLSQWLHAGLVGAGFETVLLETRHVKAALSAMTVKTDRRDARGIAQLLRLGWYRPVHAKSASAQEVRALLTARKLIQGKLLDVESGIRGVLRGFGLKVGSISRGRFEMRILELVDGHATLEEVIGAMLSARAARQMPITLTLGPLLTIWPCGWARPAKMKSCYNSPWNSARPSCLMRCGGPPT